MKKADKSGAAAALIWGEDEVASAAVTVKPLRAAEADGQRLEQQTVPVADLEKTLGALVALS